MSEVIVKERPILFSGAMMRALLAGTKNQTRRTTGLDFMNMYPSLWQRQWVPDAKQAHWLFTGQDITSKQVRCPYGVEGDRLWVRETWGTDKRLNGTPPNALFSVEGGSPIYYRADEKKLETLDTWRPSIHMPRVASRLLLEITTVRCDRLQDISEGDAVAEGIEGRNSESYLWRDYTLPGRAAYTTVDPVYSYQTLWKSINGPGSWTLNPWVWVVSFRVIDGKEVARG